jgi:hypothetical protein
MAPCRVVVELRFTRGDGRRAFRLARAIDPERLWFANDVPFPDGEPLAARFQLPDDPLPITATALVEGRQARLIAIAGEDRARILAYHRERVGQP